MPNDRYAERTRVRDRGFRRDRALRFRPKRRVASRLNRVYHKRPETEVDDTLFVLR